MNVSRIDLYTYHDKATIHVILADPVKVPDARDPLKPPTEHLNFVLDRDTLVRILRNVPLKVFGATRKNSYPRIGV